MELRELLAGADVVEIDGDPATEISSPRLRQPRRRARDAVLRRPRVHRRRARVRPAGGRRRAPPRCVVERRLELRAVRRPGGGRRRASGDGARGGALLRRPDRRAPGGRDHRHQRQDDDRLPGPPHPRAHRGPDRPAGDGEAGRRRGRRAGRAHHPGGDRPPGDLPPDGRRRRPRLRDGGLLARAQPQPRRRDPLRGRRVHQPDPGPPRLPRRHGGLLPRQAAAVRAAAAPSAW